MQIAFWSPNHGQTGTTTTAITMAITIAMSQPYKVLIGHSHFERSTMERCLLKNNRTEDIGITFYDKGIEALRRLAKNGRLLPDMVCDYTNPLLANGKLDLLEGLQQASPSMEENELALLSHIFMCAEQAYDLVMIDVHSGMNQELTRRILDKVDLVVVCLNQNLWLLEDFMKDEKTQENFAGKEVIYHISNYDPLSKYTLKNIEKLYGLSPVIGTAYNVELKDACSSGKILDFLLRLMSQNKKNRHYTFAKDILQNGEIVLGQINGLNQKEYV